MSTPLHAAGSRAATFSAGRHRTGARAIEPRVLSAARILGLWHLLSLDAPTVATLWTVFLAHAAGLALPWTEPAALFVAVWILYAADRLLDARGLRSVSGLAGLEARHRFHFRHRQWFGMALALACPLLLVLISRLGRSELLLDLVLGAFLLIWFLLIHLRPSGAQQPSRLPKELAVGVFFPAAVFLPTVARLPALRLTLLPEALLFAALCSLNGLFIYAWEHPHRRDAAHWTTRWAVSHLVSLGVVTLGAALLMAGVRIESEKAHGTASLRSAVTPLVCAAAVSLLLLLHRRRASFNRLTLRAAADLCLLTPVLLPVFERLAR